MKKVVFRLLFVFLNIFIFEGILRLFDSETVLVKTFDSVYLFTFYPGKSGRVISKEYNAIVNINSSGFRGTETSSQKTKILFLGDSFTEGWGVEDKETFTEVLNEKYSQNKKSIQAINAGIHGSSPALFALQLPLMIQKVKPDEIIVQLFDNDLDDNEKLEAFINLDEQGQVATPKKRIPVTLFGEFIYNTVKESSLWRLMARIVKVLKKEPAPILYHKLSKNIPTPALTHDESLRLHGKLAPIGTQEIEKKYTGQFAFYAFPEKNPWTDRLKKNTIYLSQIVTICKKAKISIRFLYIPAKEFFAKGSILGGIKTHSSSAYENNNPHSIQIRNLCLKENLNCIYLTKLFWDENPESLYFPHDAHLNRKGHSKLAEILYREIGR